MAVITLPKDGALSSAAGTMQRLQDIPALRQLGTLLLLAGAVALGLWIFFWSQNPPWVPLYAGLDAKSTSEATELLRASSIPFRIDPATGALAVPQEQMQQARLKLAAAGLPNESQTGFEMMERDPGFGVSQFVESARYQHALETELVRTISTLRPVRSARVHLAIPKPSAFSRSRQGASASVVLDLHPGRALEANQIQAVVHLVAASIPELSPENVTVVDQQGRMLTTTNPNSDAAVSAVQFERTQRQETALAQRIQELLEPLTGPGRVSAQVAVDMDFAVTEEAREVYNNDPAKLRSEQTAQSSSTGAAGGTDAVAQGVPGAASNTPAAVAAKDAPAPAAAPGLSQSSSNATRNYELDRTLSHVRQPAGRIQRVTAAVLVDHLPRPGGSDGKPVLTALTPDELARIESLVKEAIGFDQKRGDSVSVVNAPFVRLQDEVFEGDSAPFWQNPLLRDIARYLIGSIAVLALLFGVLRPALRQLLEARVTAPRPVVYTDDSHDAIPMPPRPAAAGAPAPTVLTSHAYEDKLRMAREAVTTDPRRVAQVVKQWVDNDG